MSDLAEQTRNAFEFIDKLFLETSYLIKEVEGQLQLMPEEFVILRPSGYGVTSLTSTGLEAQNVKLWVRKRVAVAFVPQRMTKRVKGQTVTPFSDDLRVLFLTLVAFDQGQKEPTAFFGVAENIQNKYKKYTKFEQLMWEFTYSTFKMIGTAKKIAFEDGTCSMSGEVKKLKLFSLKTNEDVRTKVVEPMVKMYRS